MEINKEIEAILFLAGEPLEIKTIASFFKLSNREIKNKLNEISNDYKQRGINLKIDDNFVQMVSNQEIGNTICKFFNPKTKPKKMSRAALETLAIIAYKQPVTRLDIEDIRGVNVENVLSKLESKGFVKVVGYKDTIGKPKLYEVTDYFLNYLGIESIEQLANYSEVKNGDYETK